MSVRKPADQRVVIVAGDRYRFLATSEDTNGAYALWHAMIPPGGGPPMHVHAREDERFDVLKGRVRFRVGATTIDAEPGDSLFAPRGTAHAFRNVTDEPAEMLLHVTPGGIERMFERVGRVARSPDEHPGPATEEDLGRIARLAPEYGIEVVGPPID